MKINISLLLMCILFLGAGENDHVGELKRLAATYFLKSSREELIIYHYDTDSLLQNKNDSTWSAEKEFSWDRILNDTRLCTTLTSPLTKTSFSLFCNGEFGIEQYVAGFHNSISQGLLVNEENVDSTTCPLSVFIKTINQFLPQERSFSSDQVIQLVKGICDFNSYGSHDKIVSKPEDIKWCNDTSGYCILRNLLRPIKVTIRSKSIIEVKLFYWKSHIWELVFTYDRRLRQLTVKGKDFGKYGNCVWIYL